MLGSSISRRSLRFLYMPIRLLFNSSINSSNSIISHYARLGQIHVARKVFDQMNDRTIASWNSIIAGYFQNGQHWEAQKLFDVMPERNVVSWNALLSGYVKSGMVEVARRVFDLMPERNVVSWTTMVRAYVQVGAVSEAELLFWMMPEKNTVSWTVMLGGLIQDGRVDDASLLFDVMPEKDVVARTVMLGGFCGEGRLAEAREIFDAMPERNVVSWTTMVQGYVQNQRVDVARKLFEVMPEKSEVSWTAMLMGYTRCGRFQEALEIFYAMPMMSAIAGTEMILGLGSIGEIDKARRVFDQVREKDERVWSAMIKVYEHKSFELHALQLFASMQRQRIRPNFHSLISILSVCASLASLDYGRQVHGQLVISDYDHDVFIASALMMMYVKCGNLEKTKQIFDSFTLKDVVMWNCMITGYAQHGLGEEALEIFHEMCSVGLKLDDVTFIGVLSACNHTGKVKEGLKIFESMKSKYLVEPRLEHYACVIDLLGRTGRINEAMDVTKTMPMEADAVIWGSLLGSCKSHKRLDLAEVAAEKLLQLEPKSSGHYTLMSQIYASKGRWLDAAEMRSSMRERNVSKSPGCSWIEVKKRVHMFTGGDSMGHPEHAKILAMLERLGGMLREVGYYPDDTFVIHDVEEEEKMINLRYHSEKLAVAYGLLMVPAPTPIRVMKNLRVCGDCHAVIKLIAEVTRREIILRDANRFHHFKDGLCSCRDYW